MAATSASSVPFHVAAAKTIFDTRFAESLTVKSVAEELSIGPDYLCQIFLKWIGEPPIRYLIRKRLDVACDLLRLNQDSTQQIGAQVGIETPYHFSRLFRKRIGMTPSKYRMNYARP